VRTDVEVSCLLSVSSSTNSNRMTNLRPAAREFQRQPSPNTTVPQGLITISMDPVQCCGKPWHRSIPPLPQHKKLDTHNFSTCPMFDDLSSRRRPLTLSSYDAVSHYHMAADTPINPDVAGVLPAIKTRSFHTPPVKAIRTTRSDLYALWQHRH
jgi:hypothetical protein